MCNAKKIAELEAEIKAKNEALNFYFKDVGQFKLDHAKGVHKVKFDFGLKARIVMADYPER